MVTRGVCWTGHHGDTDMAANSIWKGVQLCLFSPENPCARGLGRSVQETRHAICNSMERTAFLLSCLQCSFFSVVTCGWTALLGVSDCRATCLCQVSSRCARHMCEILDPTARVRGRFSWEGVFVGLSYSVSRGFKRSESGFLVYIPRSEGVQRPRE